MSNEHVQEKSNVISAEGVGLGYLNSLELVTLVNN